MLVGSKNVNKPLEKKMKPRVSVTHRGVEIARGERLNYQTESSRIAIRQDDKQTIVIDPEGGNYHITEVED